MRALITGVAGFVGGHLAETLLAEPGWEIWGSIIAESDRANVIEGVHTLITDLREPEQARVLVETARPDAVFHLAAQAYVPQAWADPWGTYHTNIRGQLNLLEAISALGLKSRVIVVSSNEVYGLIRPEDLPLSESAPLRPNNPYSVSKLAQDFMGLQYFLDRKMPIIRVRPFNHIGPRQNERFVAPSFAKQIVEIERGGREPILRLGNMAAQRDFSDVRDITRAYLLALEKGEPGEVYNIGTGQARAVREMLDLMLAHCPIKIAEEIDPAKLRPSDTPLSYADPAKFKRQTGWEPRFSFEQTCLDILNDWRERLK
ncbi:GDP-4-dehydro-6-deoxy-D-mannose reductase [Thermoflexales bacterium]|nr:GDP-4-dehydro-6-deoxy-D-mannose reductase [Thermoflexales bacterium]